MRIENPASHMDHMVRQTRAHLVQLSSMADVKANMLLTASSVVITICLPQLGHSNYQGAFRILIASCLATAVLAAWATYPRLHGQRKFTQEELDKPSFNLLFFGDFSRMEYSQFEGALETALNDPSKGFEVQAREIYSLGMFLARKKYRFVRWSYLTFLLGIVGSGVTALFPTLLADLL